MLIDVIIIVVWCSVLFLLIVKREDNRKINKEFIEELKRENEEMKEKFEETMRKSEENMRKIKELSQKK